MRGYSNAMTTYQQYLIAWASKCAASRSNDWPGFPLSQMLLSARADLTVVTDSGAVRIVRRPSTRDASRTVAYVCPVA